MELFVAWKEAGALAEIHIFQVGQQGFVEKGGCRSFYGPPAGVDEAERVAEQGTIGCDQNLPGLLKDNLGILAREFGCMCLFKKKLFKTNI